MARLTSGAAAFLLCLFGAWVAMRVLRHYRVGATSEGQLSIERRAELTAAVVQIALGLSMIGLVLTVLVADRLSDSITGAMCAYGVLAETDYGLRALAASALGALTCALWLILHRFDLRFDRPRLTRAKFTGVLALAPLLGLDLWFNGAWLLGLDMQVVASCCSLAIDGGAAPGGVGFAGGEPTRLALAAGGAGVVVAALALFAWRRPGRLVGLVLASLTPLAAGLSTLAVVRYVAPHVYETPAHACPFCLLHADAWGIGWGLFGALFAVTAFGLGAGLVALSGAAGKSGEARALVGRLAGAAALGWGIVLVLGVAPVVRYGWITGGASLFGGG